MHIAGHAGLSHEDGKILVSNGILGEVLAGEVQHHGRCVIGHHVKSITTILLAETPPVILIYGAVTSGNLVRRHECNGISNLHIRISAHILTSYRRVVASRLTARQVLHHDRVVEHTGMYEQLLLSLAQVFVTCSIMPGVSLWESSIVLEELLPCLVVGHEDGL